MNRVVVVVALVAGFESGCSWALVDRYDPYAGVASEPRCTTGRGVVASDALTAVQFAASALYLRSVGQSFADVVGPDVDASAFDALQLSIGFDWVMAGMFAASAITGLVWTGTCRSAIDEYRAAPPVVQPAARPRQRAAPVRAPKPPPTPSVLRLCFDVEVGGEIRTRCATSIERCDKERDDIVRLRPDAPVSACYDDAGERAPLERGQPPATDAPVAP